MLHVKAIRNVYFRGKFSLSCCVIRWNDVAMKLLICSLVWVASILNCLYAGEVLIVADEIPAMETLAAKLQEQENISSKIVKQPDLPANLQSYQAVIVYIHKALAPAVETACIAYANNGGKLINLHHSISSGKRTNAQWFAFMAVDLPKKDVNEGGYKWIEGIKMDIVNLAPAHFITSHKIQYEAQIEYTSSETTKAIQASGFHLHESEVYLNHTYTGPRTLLLGLKYTDEKTGKLWMQDRAGWFKPAGKGWLFYFMPGHSVREFEHPNYSRIVINAVIWKP